MSVIEVEELRKVFPTPSGEEVAVDSVSFDVEQNEFVTLVGPSGCGKTTTLRCIAGLETPTSGTIRLAGEDVTNVPANKRGLSMMFQNIALYPHMTVYQNIAYPLKVKNVDAEEKKRKVTDAAEIMQIPELLDKHPGDLSGGQRQRAALARTIVQNPVAFLMDEPLSDLDAKLKITIRKEILNVHKSLDQPTVYVTHDQEEAMTMSDTVIVMNDGNIEQIGSPEEIYNSPNNMFVARFIGNPSMNFVSGEVVERTSEKAKINIFGQELSVDNDQVTVPEDEVIVGYRPQDLHLEEKGVELTVTGELLLLEPVDNRALTTVNVEDEEIRAIVPAEANISENETISLHVALEDLYFFDPDTERSLRKQQKAVRDVPV